MSSSILVADIGGTSSRFACFEVAEDAQIRPLGSTWLRTADAQSFDDLLSRLADEKLPVSTAAADICVFAVAGPIQDGVRCSPPNIDWDIDLESVSDKFQLGHAKLINDFLAQAFASASPLGKEAERMLAGIACPKSPIAVVGAGTGLGKAVLLPDRHGGLLGLPSEGGHTNFASETQREFEFQQFVQQSLGKQYVVWDVIVSGRGLRLIHEFLSGERLEPAEVAAKFKSAPETLEWASRFYARVCRNFVLETLAQGGLYIAGGVAAKNPELISHQAFEATFRSSDAHAEVLADVPVYLIDNEESGLWGAAYYAQQELRFE